MWLLLNTSRGATGYCDLTSSLLTWTTYLDQSSISTGVQLYSIFSASTEVPQQPLVSAFFEFVILKATISWATRDVMTFQQNSDISSGISSNSWAQHSVFPPSRPTNNLLSTVLAHCLAPVNLSSFTGSRTAWRSVCPSVGHRLHMFVYISVFQHFFSHGTVFT